MCTCARLGDPHLHQGVSPVEVSLQAENIIHIAAIGINIAWVFTPLINIVSFTQCIRTPPPFPPQPVRI